MDVEIFAERTSIREKQVMTKVHFLFLNTDP